MCNLHKVADECLLYMDDILFEKNSISIIIKISRAVVIKSIEYIDVIGLYYVVNRSKKESS